MVRVNNRKKHQTEYDKFKENEPEYIASLTESGGKPPKNKKKDWVYWLVALTVVSTSIYFVVDHMIDSRDEMTQEEQIDKLSAVEAVEQMFDENKEWIRVDVTQEEFDQVKAKVDALTESSEKVKISSLLGKAEDQVNSQIEGQGLVAGLKIDSGEVNVDLSKEDLLNDLEEFPSNYNPEYVEELKAEYTVLAKKVVKAEELQTRIKALAVEMDNLLDKDELDELNEKVEDLPFSDRKSQLAYDMKALYDAYDKQQEELAKQREIEQKRQAEAESRRKEEEAIRKAEEASRKAEQARLDEIERQAREQAEWEQEQLRLQEEERQRIEDLNNYNNNNNSNNGSSNEIPESGESTESEDTTSEESESTPEGNTGNGTADESVSSSQESGESESTTVE